MNKCMISFIEIEKIRQKHINGATIKALADIYKVNYSTLYSILKRKEKRVRRTFDIYSYNIIEIRKMRELGATYQEIADKYNISYSRVYSIINKN